MLDDPNISRSIFLSKYDAADFDAGTKSWIRI